MSARGRKQGTFTIRVADTGRGFSKSLGGGTGLANIRARLAGFSEARARLRLAINEPTGVIATIAPSCSRGSGRPDRSCAFPLGFIWDAWRDDDVAHGGTSPCSRDSALLDRAYVTTHQGFFIFLHECIATSPAASSETVASHLGSMQLFVFVFLLCILVARRSGSPVGVPRHRLFGGDRGGALLCATAGLSASSADRVLRAGGRAVVVEAGRRRWIFVTVCLLGATVHVRLCRLSCVRGNPPHGSMEQASRARAPHAASWRRACRRCRRAWSRNSCSIPSPG